MATNIIENFFTIYNLINSIGKDILTGIVQYGKVASICPGQSKEYALVELEYTSHGEELSIYAEVPYSLLERQDKNEIESFIDEQIKHFRELYGYDCYY